MGGATTLQMARAFGCRAKLILLTNHFRMGPEESERVAEMTRRILSMEITVISSAMT